MQLSFVCVCVLFGIVKKMYQGQHKKNEKKKVSQVIIIISTGIHFSFGGRLRASQLIPALHHTVIMPDSFQTGVTYLWRKWFMETSHTTTVTDQIYNAVDTSFTSF